MEKFLPDKEYSQTLKKVLKLETREDLNNFIKEYGMNCINPMFGSIFIPPDGNLPEPPKDSHITI